MRGQQGLVLDKLELNLRALLHLNVRADTIDTIGTVEFETVSIVRASLSICTEYLGVCVCV